LLGTLITNTGSRVKNMGYTGVPSFEGSERQLLFDRVYDLSGQTAETLTLSTLETWSSVANVPLRASTVARFATSAVAQVEAE
jgi:hypothetical protein